MGIFCDDRSQLLATLVSPPRQLNYLLAGFFRLQGLIGRHNTLDRLAGEAFFRQIELWDTMLVTSGRVSTEMVAKAARLGIALIALRTSPTDKAIELCQ